ncbi:hypothetical protein BU16DRAFT_605984 [Lophium mytilinum]|uniref:Uncharacterized protein n=1 Tax=Lophium mytilinum TaxID=390894 RepID=A0A6A6QZS5_9PEZI|nr:hypothetical protein BU16DRAFT_605984 [Lophium mytilinum]
MHNTMLAGTSSFEGLAAFMRAGAPAESTTGPAAACGKGSDGASVDSAGGVVPLWKSAIRRCAARQPSQAALRRPSALPASPKLKAYQVGIVIGLVEESVAPDIQCEVSAFRGRTPRRSHRFPPSLSSLLHVVERGPSGFDDQALFGDGGLSSVRRSWLNSCCRGSR